MEILKKTISTLLALAMILTMLSLPALATENETVAAGAPDGPSAAETESVETVPETTAPGEEATTPSEENVETISKHASSAEAVAASTVASGTCGENLTWTLIEGVLTISGTGPMWDFSVDLAPWYDMCKSIIYVKINEGVESIGVGSFADCENLIDIEIPQSVVFIGGHAFYWCLSLKEVIIPDGVTSIEYSTFHSCHSLESVTIPDGVTIIDDGAFMYCYNLKNVNIPNSVSKIGSNAFDYCMSLENVVLPPSITEIRYEAFSCTDLSRSRLVIPNGVTYLGMRAFYYSNLPSIVIPVSVTAIEEDAFRGSKLKKIFYEGSEEQWNKIEFTYPGIHEDVEIIFGYSSDQEKNVVESICFFHNWDAENQIAYLGDKDEETLISLGYQVTEETDTSFQANVNSLVGTYVLAKTKVEVIGAISKSVLLSIKPLETKTSTVTSADASAIVIGGTSYSTPETLESPESYANQNFVYHLYEGNIVGIEILQTMEGILTSWNKEANAINIKQNADDELATLYKLSPLADDETVEFLGETGSRGTDVIYLIDSNNILYQIKRTGFNPEKDAWSFRNNYDGFGYDKPYRIPDKRYEKVFGASYVASARASSEDVFDSMMPEWGGNCYGMSVTSVLFYLNMLDWVNYRGSNFDTVNSYYSEIRRKTTTDELYAISEEGRPITELIESYQILQNGSKDGYRFINSTATIADSSEYRVLCSDSNSNEFEKYESYYIHNPGGNYIQTLLDTISASDVPLILGICGSSNGKAAGHAMVLRTDIKPQKMDDGTYRVYVYDPNHPYISDKVVGEFIPASYYSNDKNLYVELYPGINQWRYCGSVNGSTAEGYWGSDSNWNVLSFGSSDGKTYTPDTIYASAIQNVGMPLQFDGTEAWLSAYESETGFILNGSVDIYSEDNVLIYSTKNGLPVYSTDGVEFKPFINAMDESAVMQGRVTIPHTKFIIECKDASDISIIGFDNVINIASSGNIVLSVSINNGEIVISSTDDAELVIQITNVYSSSEYTSVVANGTVTQGDIISLQLNDDRFDADYDGAGSVEISTDNENAPDGQHVMTLDESDGEVGIVDIRDELPNEHTTHTAGTDWFSDNANHWHKCTDCEEIMDLTAHSGGTATCANTAVCSTCGTSYGELVAHEYQTTWSKGDANGHWHECKNCSAHDAQVKHTPGAAATTSSAQTCTVCGYVITPALGHACTAGTKWYSNATYHWHECTACGEKLDEAAHNANPCTICGYESVTEGDHPYSLGDVNHDGKINAKDSTLILQYSVGMLKDTSKFCETCANVNGDSKLNAKDATMILQYSVGLRTDF